MGKDLRGREMGEGIMQRKDGRYSARFTSRRGRRVEKCFDTVADARKWYMRNKLQDEQEGEESIEYTMTVDQWFHYWLKTFKSNLSPNTIRNYTDRYYSDVKNAIGDMLLVDVKAMHCQQILNNMEPYYAKSTIYQTYICIGSMFKSALKNDLITRHPLDGVDFKCNKMKKPIRFLDLEEQNIFLAYYHPYGGTANLHGQFQPEGKPPYMGCDMETINQYLQENQLRMYEKESGNCGMEQNIHMLPGIPQLRTARRIRGNATLTGEDCYRHCDTSIGTICDFEFRDRLYEVPYGVLVKDGFDNLITCGRSASASGWGWDVLRVIPPAVLTGQAAGIAAALAATHDRLWRTPA